MHLIRSLSLSFTCLAAPGMAAAQDAPPADAVAEEEAPSTKDSPIIVDGERSRKQKKVCMSETATGSIMARRVCYTVAQLEERERIAEYIKQELGKKQMRDRQVSEEAASRR